MALAENHPDRFPPPDIAIRAEGLSKFYDGVRAIDGVSLDVKRGEVLCVIGPNGAGKTTLLALLGGIIYPKAGTVSVFSEDRWQKNFELRKRSTYLPPQPIIGETPTPYEYHRFLAQIYGMTKPDFLDRLRALTADMKLAEHLHKSWHSLSLGLFKKAGLIGAFLPDAELRIMDEPFAGGIDPLGMEMLYTWMNRARLRGETILFSTQVLDQAEAAADRILLLDRGKIAAVGTPAELLALAKIPPTEPRGLAKAFVELTR